MENENNSSNMSGQRRRKLGAIGRSSTLSQSLEINSYPRENIVTCAEYPNSFPKRYNSGRYRFRPHSFEYVKESDQDFHKSQCTIREHQVSNESDSTPLLRLSSLSSQYNLCPISQSPTLLSLCARSEDLNCSPTNFLHHNSSFHIYCGARNIDAGILGDTNSICECRRSPGVLSKSNSIESINFFDPEELSIENYTLSKCALNDSTKLKSGSTGSLHNSVAFGGSGPPTLERSIAGARTISASLGSKGIVGAAGLGIGIGAGNFDRDISFLHFGREFPITRCNQTTLNIDEDEEAKNFKVLLNSIGWWGIRIFLYTFYVGVLIILLTYIYVATEKMVPINVFLIVLSVVLFVFILFCVCFIVFI